MDTLEQLRSAVQSDLTITSSSTLFPITTVDLAINRAYRKAGGLFRWPELEDAKKTSTEEGQEYYDYPDNWQPDSIWKLKVNGERYGEPPTGNPLSFDDYLNWKEDNPNSTEKKWSSQWRRFFFWPIPSSDGNNNICVWGQKTVTTMSENSDVTIFSYSMPECNEAIVLEAVAILKAKGEDEKSTEFKSTEAKAILAIAWGKIRQNQAKYHKIQPYFQVPDMFGNRREEVRSRAGNF